jgi:hypothetical protein
MEVIEMFRNYVFMFAVLVLIVVVNDSIAFSADESFNVKGQKTAVSGTSKVQRDVKAMNERGLASAQKAVLMADTYKEVCNEIRLTEKELKELVEREKVLGQVTKKLKVARFRAQCREKANPSADSDVLRRRLQDFAFQINNQKEDLDEIKERIPVLTDRLKFSQMKKDMIETERGRNTDGLDKNLDKDFEEEIRKRWESGSTHINLSSLIDYP